MTHSSIEREPPAVRHFLQTMMLTPGGSVYELNGKRLMIRVIPDRDEEWSPAKDSRRNDLIDRKVAGTTTRDEDLELELLQDELQDNAERVAPLPMEYARQLHRELLAKADLADAS